MVEFSEMLLIISLLYLKHLWYMHLLWRVVRVVILVFHQGLTDQSTYWFDLACLCVVYSVSQRHQLFTHQIPYGFECLSMHFGYILHSQKIFLHLIALSDQMHDRTFEFHLFHHHENCSRLLSRKFRLPLQLNQILVPLFLSHDSISFTHDLDLSKRLQL